MVSKKLFVLRSKARSPDQRIHFKIVFPARKVNANISMIKWKDMNAKNVYDLQRALTGLYPLTTKFKDNTIKVFGIRVCEEPPRLPNLPKDKPGFF